jgi:hypothetical protein
MAAPTTKVSKRSDIYNSDQEDSIVDDEDANRRMEAMMNMVLVGNESEETAEEQGIYRCTFWPRFLLLLIDLFCHSFLAQREYGRRRRRVCFQTLFNGISRQGIHQTKRQRNSRRLGPANCQPT